ELADRDLVFNRLLFCFPGGELLLAIPIPADDTGVVAARGRRARYIWYRPVDERGLAVLCTDASGRQHGITIPPPLIRPELIADLPAGGPALPPPELCVYFTAGPRARLPPVLCRMVERAERPLFQAMFDLASPQMVIGRVVLL